ncbi:pre-mRNA 3'-end-processing factor FIP1 isoform X1 [Ictalurus furcatus]|uniref:pre-mRNA 3'-end-processing factor FIP1-like isoform X1 n=1 Tax=Ictalurus furcatus TaxID=66913 RepID=UPI00235003FE|nr:pre-mRNA 3'-end-processing factor FIP1-like isoform X1 [Ictalurus furcatus]XP_053470353.1 pre-mRNA 3'-end-processing factor FIP1 isoform X1 [Ictalurus furcatus]
MSTGETEKTTGNASVDDEDWLYGDNDDDVNDAAGDDDDKKTETEIFSALVGDVEGVNGVDHQDADSDSDSDDNLRVTIGNIKTDIQSTSTAVNLKTSGITTVSGTKVRGVALVAVDGIIGTPELEVDEEKPWRKPGADLSDYFNYGFNEDTWKTYCDKQRRLRMSLEFMTLGSSDKTTGSHDEPVSKSDCSSRKLKNSIDVIGGQTETIIRVEGRRHHSTDGSSMQVPSSSERPVDAEPPSSKPPPFFAPIIPSPPFPLLSISSTPPFIQHPPRPPMSVPPPGFPLPPEVPSLPFTSGSGRSGGSYDGRCAPLYPFAAGVYPHALGPMTPWLGLSDRAKVWKPYSCQDKERERGKDRERTRDREPKKEHERERDQENTPAFRSRSSDKERASRHREHGDRERERHREHDRDGREREERHRDRKHRERTERRKSSRSSSSRRRHSSDDGESHRRHRYKRSKRNKDSTDTESTD